MPFIIKILKRIFFNDKGKGFLYVIYTFLIASLLFGGYMHFVEKLSPVDTYYYLVTTATTVGYGDISPTTGTGKILSTVYMVLSISAFGIILAKIGESLVEVANKTKKGKIKMKNTNLIIIGYPGEDKVKEIVEELRSDDSFKEKKISIISNTLEEKPDWFTDLDVKFVKGLGSDQTTLKNAGLSEQTETVLVLAIDPKKIESDDYSSSAVAVINKVNPNTRIIAEKVRKDNILFESIGCDTITRVSSPSLLAQEILDPGAVEFAEAVFSNETIGTQYNCIYNGEKTTWEKLALNFIKNNAIPEGYRKDGKFNFLPTPKDVIEPGTEIKYRAKERIEEVC